MHTLNEKGGILLELSIMAFILLVFSAGAAAMHRSFHQRFESIVAERNENIRAIRAQSP